MTMKPGEAAKVLREHNAWRRGEVTNPMPYNPRILGEAIDAAVAALEAVDTITERARELIGLHMSEQEGLRLPTGAEYQRAIDALAQAIGAIEQSPPSQDSHHPREIVLAQDAARGNFRYNNDPQNDGA